MEKIKEQLTNEEIEILKNILLERSTFYTKKITEYMFLVLKLTPEKLNLLEEYENNIDYSYKCMNATDKLFELLKE